MSTIPAHGQSPITPSFVPAEIELDYDKFITEDDKPVDSIYAERQHRLLVDSLFASWQAPGGRPHLAATDVGLVYAVNEPAVAPDVMISMGVKPPIDGKPKKFRSYFVWLYGKSPKMTLEVVSNLEGGELTSKMEKYARIGVIYYVVWDPECWLSKTPLQCFVLNGGKYVPCEPWFPLMELGVTTWDGDYDGFPDHWLRFCDRAGRPFPTGIERARIAEQHAAQLAAKLRAAGIDPDV
jgi:hypothetical protein